MAQTAEFVIGADASCTDGPCGQVTRVVVNPVAQTVTHLVVEPKHRQGLGRLVPLDLVSGPASTAAQVRLSCTQEEFHRLDSAEETQFIPGTAGYAEYGPDQVLAWPYYGLGAASARRPPWRRRASRRPSPWTPSRPASWPSAAATACTPPTAPSGTSRAWSSTRPATT